MGMEDLAKPHMPNHSKHGMGRTLFGGRYPGYNLWRRKGCK